MLTRVEVYTQGGAMLALPLDDISGGYLVEDISGLDPVKATIVSSSYAQRDGSHYQHSRRENRDIGIKLKIEPDYINKTVRQLRDDLYDFFMPKSYVTLRFYMDDAYFADITGRVEVCDAPLFVKEPRADIDIVCFDPDFTAPNFILFSGLSTSEYIEVPLDYPGTTETGFYFEFKPNRPISEFTVHNRISTGETQSMHFAASMAANDIVSISTIPGLKSAELIQSGMVFNLLYGVTPASTWLKLYRGINHIRVQAEGAPIPFTMTYQPRYGGL